MKSIKPNLLSVAFFGIVLLFGCQKESARSLPSSASTQENKSAAISGVTQTLSLRPGPADGQDVYVEWKADDSHTANVNFDYVPELPPQAWTDGGAQTKERIFISFTGLSALPTTATVASATLYLYGLSSSLNSPQGNSYYPGSPYLSYGSNACSVSRALSAWNESTITWNNQPATTVFNQATLPASTSQWNYDAQVNVTALVRQYVKHPELNFGVCIKEINETPYHCMVFGSCEAAENDRPMLVVEYKL